MYRMHISKDGQIPEEELCKKLEELGIIIGGENCPLEHLRDIGYVERDNGNYRLTESVLTYYS